MNEYNFGNKIRIADFYSDADETAMEDMYISKCSTEDELCRLFNLKEKYREAKEEYFGYRNYLYSKAKTIENCSTRLSIIGDIEVSL